MIALVLLLAEAHVSSGGLIAVGAAVALIGGVALLVLSSGAGLPIVLGAAAVVCAASGAGLVALSRTFKSVRQLRPRSGTEAMIGRLGVVRVSDSAERVFVDGGLWRARASELDEGRGLRDGDRVVVERVNGLTLCVRKAEEWELNP